MAVTSQLLGSKNDSSGPNWQLLPTLGVTSALALSVMSNQYRRKVENTIQAKRRRNKRKLGAAQIDSNNPILKAQFTELLPEVQRIMTDAFTRAAQPQGSLTIMDNWQEIRARQVENLEAAREAIKQTADQFNEEISKSISDAGSHDLKHITRQQLERISGIQNLIGTKNIQEFYADLVSTEGAKVDATAKHRKAADLTALMNTNGFTKIQQELKAAQEQLRMLNDRLATTAYEKADLEMRLADEKNPELVERHHANLNDINYDMEKRIEEMSLIKSRINTYSKAASFYVIEEVAKNEGLLKDGVPQVEKVTIDMLDKRGLLGINARRSQILQLSTTRGASSILGERVSASMTEAIDMHDAVTSSTDKKIDFSDPRNLKFHKIKTLRKVSNVLLNYVKSFRQNLQALGPDIVADDYMAFSELMPELGHIENVRKQLDDLLKQAEPMEVSLKLEREKQAGKLFQQITKTSGYHVGSFEGSVRSIVDLVGNEIGKSIQDMDVKFEADTHRLVFDITHTDGRSIRLGMPIVFKNAYAQGAYGKQIVTKETIIDPFTEHMKRMGEGYHDVNTKAADSIRQQLSAFVANTEDARKLEGRHERNLRADEIHLDDPSILRLLKQTQIAFTGIKKGTKQTASSIAAQARKNYTRAAVIRDQITDILSNARSKIMRHGERSEIEKRVLQLGEDIKNQNFATFQRATYDLLDAANAGTEEWGRNRYAMDTLNALIGKIKRLESKLQVPGEKGMANIGERNFHMGTNLLVADFDGAQVHLPISYQLSDSLAAQSKVRIVDAINSHIAKGIHKTQGTGRSARPWREKGHVRFLPSSDAKFGNRVDIAKSAGWVMFKASANLEEEGEHIYRKDFIDDLQMRKEHTGTIKAKHHIGGGFVFDGLKNVELIPLLDKQGKEVAGVYEVKVTGEREMGTISLDNRDVHVHTGDVFAATHDPTRTGAIHARVIVHSEDTQRLKIHLMNAGGGSAKALNKDDMTRTSVELMRENATRSGPGFDADIANWAARRIVGHMSYKTLMTNVHESIFHNVTQSVMSMTRDASLERLSGDSQYQSLLNKEPGLRTKADIEAIQRIQQDIRMNIRTAAERLEHAISAGTGFKKKQLGGLAEHFRTVFNNKFSSASLQELLSPIVNIKDPATAMGIVKQIAGDDFNVAHFMSGTGRYTSHETGKVAFKDLISHIGETRWYRHILGQDYTHEQVRRMHGAKGIESIMLEVNIGATPEHKLPMERTGPTHRRGYLQTKGGMPINLDALMMMEQGGLSNTAAHIMAQMKGNREVLDKRFYFLNQYTGMKTHDQIMRELQIKHGNERLNPFRVTTDHTIASQERSGSFRQLAEEIAGDDRIDKIAQQTGRQKMANFDKHDNDVKLIGIDDRAARIAESEALDYFSKASFKQRLEAGILTTSEFERFKKLIKEKQVLEIVDKDLQILGSSADQAQFAKSGMVTDLKEPRLLPSGSEANRIQHLYMPDVKSMREGVTHRRINAGQESFVKLDGEFKNVLSVFAKAVGATNADAKEDVKKAMRRYHSDAVKAVTRITRKSVLKTKAEYSLMGLAQSHVGIEILKNHLVTGNPLDHKTAKAISNMFVDPRGNLEKASEIFGEYGMGHGQPNEIGTGTDAHAKINLEDFQLEHNTRAISKSRFRGILAHYLQDNTKILGERLAYVGQSGLGMPAMLEGFEESFGVIKGVMNSVSKEKGAEFQQKIFEAIGDRQKITRHAKSIPENEMAKLKDGLRTKIKALAEDIADVFSKTDKRMLNLGERFPIIGFGGIKPMMLQIINDDYMSTTEKKELSRIIATDRFTAKESGADFDGDFIYSMALFRKTHATEALREMVRRNIIVRKHNEFMLPDGNKINIRTVDNFLSGSTASLSLQHATDGLLEDLGNDVRLQAAIKGDKTGRLASEVTSRLQLRVPDGDHQKALDRYFSGRKQSIKNAPIKSGYGDKSQYIVRSETVGDSFEHTKSIIKQNLSRLGVDEAEANKIVDEVFGEVEQKALQTHGAANFSVSTLGFGSDNDNDLGRIQQQHGKFKRFNNLSNEVKRRLKSSPELWKEIVNPEELGLMDLLRPNADIRKIREAQRKRIRVEDINNENDQLMQKVLQDSNGRVLGKNGKIIQDFHESVRKLAGIRDWTYQEAYNFKLRQFTEPTNNRFSKDAKVIMKMDKYIQDKGIMGEALEAHIGVKQLTGALDTWQKSFQNSYYQVASMVQDQGLNYTREYTFGVAKYLESIQQNAISSKHGNSPVASGLIDAFRDLSVQQRKGETATQMMERVNKSWTAVWEGSGIEVHTNEFERRYGKSYLKTNEKGRITLEKKIAGYERMNMDLGTAIDHLKKGDIESINSMIKRYDPRRGKGGNSALYHIMVDGKLTGQDSEQAIRRIEEERRRNSDIIKGYQNVKEKVALKHYLTDGLSGEQAQIRMRKAYTSFIANQTMREVTGENYRAMYKKFAGSSSMEAVIKDIHGFVEAQHAMQDPTRAFGTANKITSAIMGLQQQAASEDAIQRSTQGVRRAQMELARAPALSERATGVIHGTGGQHFTAMSAMDHVYEAVGKRIRKGASSAQERSSGRSAIMVLGAGFLATSALMPGNLAGDQSGLGGEYFSAIDSKNERKAAMRQREWLSRRMTGGTAHIRIEDNRFRNLRHTTSRDVFGDMINASYKPSVNVYGPTPATFQNQR